MNNYFIINFILILVFFDISSAYAQNTKNEITAIKKVLLKQENDWNNGNIEAYMQGYWNSDSLLFIGKSGPKYGWKTTLENYIKSYPDQKSMGILKFEFLKIELLSLNNAIVIGKWQLTREKDTPSGYYSLVLKKMKGKWKIVIDHSS